MALSPWKPLEDKLPSSTRKGEQETSAIYTAVGNALSRWEHMESGLTRLFQLLCETPGFAACRAYGTIESSYTKAGMLRAAMKAFFANREPFDKENHDAVNALLSAYQVAQQYRNNIAHGIAVGFFLSDGTHSWYFLCPPSYASKKVERIDPREVYLLGAAYWYKAQDIDYYAKRFEELLAETMRLIQDVNKKYRVLQDGQFHP
jgi:hypothetical protein